MKKPYIIIGIDPGASGGLATLALDVQEIIPVPDTLEDLRHWFRYWEGREHLDDVRIYMEQVGGFIGTRPGGGEHRNIASGHTMFAFGKRVGHIEMAIECAGLTHAVTRVSPRKWQAAFGIAPKSKGESQSSFKNRIKAKAAELFPGLKVTLKTADALLIAEYGRRQIERT